MAINQREVYLLPHPINPSSIPPHPFIVLSTRQANDHERTFVAVMITASDKTHDDFSFDVSDDMFIKPLEKQNCHVRMHLITLMINEDIIGRRINEMKEFYFKELMASIGDLIFNYGFKPI